MALLSEIMLFHHTWQAVGFISASAARYSLLTYNLQSIGIGEMQTTRSVVAFQYVGVGVKFRDVNISSCKQNR